MHWILLITLLPVTAALPRVPGIELVGQGYNILLANPDVVGVRESPEDGGLDPGYTGKTILKITYNDQREDMLGRYEIPDQVTFSPKSGCSNLANQLFNSENSYRNILTAKYHTSGFEGFQHTAFTVGMGFKDPHSDVYFQSGTACLTGLTAYDLMQPDPSKHHLDENFVDDVCGLETAEQQDYFNLIDKYGTHIVKGADLGYSTISRRVDTLKNFLTGLEKAPSYAYKFNLGVPKIYLTVNPEELQSSIDQIFGTESQTWTVGSETSPTSIGYQLLRLPSIIGATSPEWKSICSEASRSACCKALSTIRRKLDDALRVYAAYKNVDGGWDDSHLLLPVKWPASTYGLPSTDIGCPSNSFKTGKVIQNMGGWFRSSNQVSSGNHFPSGTVKDDSVRQYFCIQDQVQADQTNFMTFEKGSYCVFKKNECPKGLNKEGALHFEDDKGTNSNWGSLPDGNFYKVSTKLDFCCRNDGSTVDPIILPSDKGFFLLRHGGVCQSVHNMQARQETITFSRPYWPDFHTLATGTSPDVAISGDSMKVYYCYYEPITSDKLTFVLNTLSGV